LRAEQTFIAGDPAMGCLGVYKELEALTRRIAVKTYKRGYWTETIRNPSRMVEKTAWVRVTADLKSKLSRTTAAKSGMDLSNLSDVLLSRIIGVTPFRNLVGHSPNSARNLRERDARLRTRMEDAVDLLRETIDATRCLRL
jgi:hypothetical protein